MDSKQCAAPGNGFGSQSCAWRVAAGLERPAERRVAAALGIATDCREDRRSTKATGCRVYGQLRHAPMRACCNTVAPGLALKMQHF
jgi:hypothetical protein